MKILVLGSWHPEKAREFLEQANQVGSSLAKRKHTLVASPSSGFQGLVAVAYKQEGGPHFVGYYPNLLAMKSVGEKVLVEPDEKVYTRADYPIRNLMQLRDSDAVIGITGGYGTLTELIVSVTDYGLPTTFYSGSSKVVDGFLKHNLFIAKEIKCGKDINELVDYLEDMYKR